MKNKKLTAEAWIVSCVLAALLCAGGVLPAAAEDTPKKETAGQQDIPVKKPPTKKSTVKTPGTFVPTDKVSSDQAVAFPTDM
jgi:hypothetical protein